MKTIGRAALPNPPRLILCWFALLCACVVPLRAPLSAQTPASQSPSSPSASAPTSAVNAVPAAIRDVKTIEGAWRFREGDDPEWAVPGFNDSDWQPVTLGEPLSAQGLDPYSGFAWYRIRLQPQLVSQLGDTRDSRRQPALLVTGNSIGQIAVYINGIESGHTRGMAEQLAEYRSLPIVVPLSASGPTDIAIRTWAGPTENIDRGLLTKVELGPRDDIADRLALAVGRQWNEYATSALVLAFIFVSVALLGGALYLAQPNHSEYLWLAILCVFAALGRTAHALFGLALISLPVYRVLSIFAGFIFAAVTIEFVFRFTGSAARRTVRAVQLAVLLVPFAQFIPSPTFDGAVSLSAEAVFCALVTVMLFQAWRRGRGDAGAMLLPFFLAASTDLIDSGTSFAAGKQWIPERFASSTFHLGPIAYTVGNVTDVFFLSSLIAVILYRFIRVSQDEQRANAEITAARSVQALLIPTQLPSNKNFMLESAYLPVNGVGGDFFQVLPLKDDSLLIVVGDVSGKGLQAAMNSSTLVGALRNELAHDPATVLQHLNHVLIGAVPSSGAVPELECAPCFATCLCARIYPSGEMTVANAGHLSPYRDGRELALQPGLPLGVIADADYEQTTFQLNRGDRLVFISDGVVEATNAHGELFGFERTQQVSHESARYIAQTAQHFGQTDDITVLSLYVASRTAQRMSEEFVHSS
jgi:phosphoserine phosphatase RsbU/P